MGWKIFRGYIAIKQKWNLFAAMQGKTISAPSTKMRSTRHDRSYVNKISGCGSDHWQTRIRLLRCCDARREPRKTSDTVPFVCRSSHGKTLSNANRDANQPIKRILINQSTYQIRIFRCEVSRKPWLNLENYNMVESNRNLPNIERSSVIIRMDKFKAVFREAVSRVTSVTRRWSVTVFAGSFDQI